MEKPKDLRKLFYLKLFESGVEAPIYSSSYVLGVCFLFVNDSLSTLQKLETKKKNIEKP